jgi:mono/diheme cytochrome c family protein
MIKSISIFGLLLTLIILATLPALGIPPAPDESGPLSVSASAPNAGTPAEPLATQLGVEFLPGSASTVILEREGRRYLVDLASQRVSEVALPAAAHPSSLQGEKASVAQEPDATKIFKAKCATCHGVGGEGIASIKTPDFTSAEVQASVSDADILDTIKKGRPGTMMPAWNGKLSDQDMNAVARYIRSLGTPQTASAASAAQKPRRKVYQPGDDVLMSLPTGRATASTSTSRTASLMTPPFTVPRVAAPCWDWTVSLFHPSGSVTG